MPSIEEVCRWSDSKNNKKKENQTQTGESACRKLNVTVGIKL